MVARRRLINYAPDRLLGLVSQYQSIEATDYRQSRRLEL